MIKFAIALTKSNTLILKYLFRNTPIESIFYSSENCAKFDANSFIFGDLIIEILHYSERDNKFKQLFVIQFHSFFVSGNSMRFTKDQIDGICKDIRYPSEFFIDLIFDEDKATNISTYEEDVAKWKNIISDFIMKSYRSTSNNSNINITTNDVTTTQIVSDYKEDTKKGKVAEINEHIDNDDKEEDMHNKPNTFNKAQEILNKFSKENKDVKKDNDEEEEDDDDDDIENYLKDLENKSKR